MKTKVAIMRCESYDKKLVYDSIKKGIELIGGVDSIVKKDEKILLKVNNLAGSNPDEAAVTHPAIFEAMIKILLEKDVKVMYGDSSGFGKPEPNLKKSGFFDVASRYKIELGDFEKGKIIDYPDGIVGKKFNIANACLESEGIISVSKMKTHGLARITGAVKNQFGCIYGLNKAGYHVKMPNPTTFSKMLVDLTKFLKPRLYILDGIVAMEGNGPRSGIPVKMNCIIISKDPVAVDATFARMVNINPMFVPTIKFGKKMGLGTYSENEIEYYGDPLESFINKNFKVVRKPVKNTLLRSFIPSFLRNLIYSRPVIDSSKCIKCGVCVNSCPLEEKALNFKDKHNPPEYDYKKCIRCFCCQEMCPQKAIYIAEGWI